MLGPHSQAHTCGPFRPSPLMPPRHQPLRHHKLHLIRQPRHHHPSPPSPTKLFMCIASSTLISSYPSAYITCSPILSPTFTAPSASGHPNATRNVSAAPTLRPNIRKCCSVGRGDSTAFPFTHHRAIKQ
jgi:hypothetical protein